MLAAGLRLLPKNDAKPENIEEYNYTLRYCVDSYGLVLIAFSVTKPGRTRCLFKELPILNTGNISPLDSALPIQLTSSVKCRYYSCSNTRTSGCESNTLHKHYIIVPGALR